MSLLFGREEQLKEEEWKERFKWNFDQEGLNNNAGYGPDKPYIPPLQNPSTIYGLQERHDLLLETGDIWSINNFFFITSLPFAIFLEGLGQGDSQDRFWYNNAYAEGYQTYPTGIHKYYDMFSLSGYYTYYIDYYIARFLEMWGLFTYGIPLDVLWGIKNGTSFENIWYYLLMPRIYFKHLWLPIIGLEVEKGFKLD